MTAMVIALGFAVLFQFIILRVKWNRGDYPDVIMDVILLFILNAVFGGSILGVISATAGSTLISLYLIWKPLQFLRTDTNKSKSQQAEEVMSKVATKLDELLK